MQNIRQNLLKMSQAMQNYNRFSPLLQRIATRQPNKLAEAQKTVTDFFTAVQTIEKKYLDSIDKEAANINMMPFLVKCMQSLMDSTTKQTTSANSLMKLPTDLCTELNAAFKSFKDDMDATYNTIA